MNNDEIVRRVRQRERDADAQRLAEQIASFRASESLFTASYQLCAETYQRFW